MVKKCLVIFLLLLLLLLHTTKLTFDDEDNDGDLLNCVTVIIKHKYFDC